MTCEHCDDGIGECIYPYYGMAPHKHNGGSMIGSTIIIPPDQWPVNFKPDLDEGEDISKATTGVYTHCLECGGGK